MGDNPFLSVSSRIHSLLGTDPLQACRVAHWPQGHVLGQACRGVTNQIGAGVLLPEFLPCPEKPVAPPKCWFWSV